MKQINLKEYYPFYTTDTIVEVPDEVADILRAYKLRDEAYRIYTYRHKAYFSLDFGDGIEYEASQISAHAYGNGFLKYCSGP